MSRCSFKCNTHTHVVECRQRGNRRREARKGRWGEAPRGERQEVNDVWTCFRHTADKCDKFMWNQGRLCFPPRARSPRSRSLSLAAYRLHTTTRIYTTLFSCSAFMSNLWQSLFSLAKDSLSTQLLFCWTLCVSLFKWQISRSNTIWNFNSPFSYASIIGSRGSRPGSFKFW